MARLEIDRVSKTFPNGFEVLRDITIDVRSGEFLTLLGPSGCGKTTLLKAIASFHSISTGRFLIDGTDVTDRPPEKRDTSMCFQSYALFPHLTVSENILFGPKQNRIPKEECNERLKTSLRQVDLDAHADKLPSALSGGQQQRVALARAIAMRPGIILFDEPLSNLDAKLREQVRFELRALQAEHGFTAVYVTHDQAEALAMSDRIVVMNAGHVAQIGTPTDIYDRPATRFVADFIGAANIHRAEVIGRVAPTTWQLRTDVADFKVETDKDLTDRSYYICWRPEDAVIVSDSGAGVNTLVASVEAQAFQGNVTDVLLRSEKSAQTYRIQTRKPLPVNSNVTISIAPEKISVLEAAQ